MNALNLKIESRRKIYFEGKVKFVVSNNRLGDFSIFKNHANMICIVNDYLTYEDSEENPTRIEFDSAILVVKNNTVNVFIVKS
jgi:F0F1-type ATP synthase epsilon subunit